MNSSEPQTTVRTRFAPSPTGFLHVGGVRTALFAWLVARQAGGKFVLRIEDTDRERHVEGAESHIIDSLKALGLDYDEGPDKPGAFGPYRQSQRLEIYKEWAQKLVESGRAYPDPYSAQQLQAFREVAQKAKQPFLYRNHRPEKPGKWDGRQPLRFKSEPRQYSWQDEVMGKLHAGVEVVDDFILIKSDGFPTYNFAHIVDDAQMQISHVIRGQEFLASVPNYLNLYEALGLERPLLATMPHVLAPGGNKKLSKRDGAKDVLEYVREGYLPDALVNFIATLGWNDGTDQEIFSKDELVDKFKLSRVGRSGAHFDEKRLVWMNGHYIRELPLDVLAAQAEAFWPPSAAGVAGEYKTQVVGLLQERLKYLAELPQLSSFFFEEPKPNLELISGNKTLGKLGKSQLAQLLKASRQPLAECDFTVGQLNSILNDLLGKTDQKPGVLFGLIRIVTTWSPASPGLADSLHLLGKDKSLARIDQAIALLEK